MKRIPVTGSHIVEQFQGKCDIRVLDNFRSSNLDGLDCEPVNF